MTLRLVGHVPSKKNQWRPKPGGGITTFAASGVKAAIDSLAMQARIQWGARPAVESPELTICFSVRDRRGDRDNKLSTILDVLQIAGVLRNDNIAHCNGDILIRPALICSAEGVHVDIYEAKPGGVA